MCRKYFFSFRNTYIFVCWIQKMYMFLMEYLYLGNLRFVDVLKMHIFLMEYWYFCMLNTKNVHFPSEISIFWLLWEAKNAARARGHIPRQIPGRVACWEPKMLILYWFLHYFRIQNEAAQPPAPRIQFLKEPQGPHSASTVWGICIYAATYASRAL